MCHAERRAKPIDCPAGARLHIHPTVNKCCASRGKVDDSPGTRRDPAVSSSAPFRQPKRSYTQIRIWAIHFRHSGRNEPASKLKVTVHGPATLLGWP